MLGKSKGKLVYCSDFISPDRRIIIRNTEGVIIEDTRKIIYPGSNRDPWWDTKQLLLQLTDTLNIFEKKYPDCTAVLVFDQSSAHASHGDGALNAFSMNLADRGKQPLQKDTIFPPECAFPELRGQKQELFTLDDKGVKVLKGIKTVLQERGCLPAGKLPNVKYKVRCPDLILYPITASDKLPCCLARLLSSYYDFYHQKSAIATLIEERGHKCIFLPKFHYELNPIEMY